MHSKKLWENREMKRVILLAGIVLVLPFVATAEMIVLTNYTVDMGSYFLPVNGPFDEDYRRIVPPTNIGIGTIEGIRWRYGIDEPTNFLILNRLSVPFDPISFMTNMMNETLESFGEEIPEPLFSIVNRPYPGLVSSQKFEKAPLILTSYVGVVDNETLILVQTFDEPARAAHLLQNIRVITKSDVNKIITSSIAGWLDSQA